MPTTAPDSGDPVVSDLYARGERLTPQRLLVLEVLRHDPHHLTAETIFARVRERYPYMNQATVYRVLTWLKEQGVISETDLGMGQTEYEYLGAHRHHHLICLHCGQRQEFDDALVGPLVEALRERYGFAPRIDHLAVFGACQMCQAAEQSAKERAD